MLSRLFLLANLLGLCGAQTPSPYPSYKWVHWTSATVAINGIAHGYVDLSSGERVNVTYLGEIRQATLHGATSDPFSSQGWFLPPKTTGFYLQPYEGWSMYGGGTKASVQLSTPVKRIAVGLISVGQPSVQQTLQFNSAVKRGPVNYNFGAYGLSFPNNYTVTGNEGNGVVITDEMAPDAGQGIDALLWTHVGYEVYTVLTTGIIDEPLPVTGGSQCDPGLLTGSCSISVPVLTMGPPSGQFTFLNMTGAGSTGIGPVAHAFPRSRFFSFTLSQAVVTAQITTCLTTTAVDTYLYLLSSAPRGSLSPNQLGLVAFNDDQGENTPWAGASACTVGTQAIKKSLIQINNLSAGTYWVVALLRGATDGAVGIQWTFTYASPTPSASISISPSRTVSGTLSASYTATLTGSSTRTSSHSQSVTPTLSPTSSGTQSVTPTISPTGSVSSTPTGTPTLSSTSSVSSTPTGTPTISPTGSVSSVPTKTPTISPTGSVSSLATRTPTISTTGSVSSLATRTPTGSVSSVPTKTPTNSAPAFVGFMNSDTPISKSSVLIPSVMGAILGVIILVIIMLCNCRRGFCGCCCCVCCGIWRKRKRVCKKCKETKEKDDTHDVCRKCIYENL